MSFSSLVALNVQGAASSALDLETVSRALSKTYSVSLASGTGAGQADKYFSDTRTLAASTTEDLDLNGTGLQDAFGANLALARVKAIIVSAWAANTNNVVVGGAASNGFVTPFGGATHTVTVRPGGFIALSAGLADATGYLVTAATGDLLRIGNSGAGTSVTYDIVVIGASA
jgi:hypothetical protein